MWQLTLLLLVTNVLAHADWKFYHNKCAETQWSYDCVMQDRILTFMKIWKWRSRLVAFWQKGLLMSDIFATVNSATCHASQITPMSLSHFCLSYNCLSSVVKVAHTSCLGILETIRISTIRFAIANKKFGQGRGRGQPCKNFPLLWFNHRANFLLLNSHAMCTYEGGPRNSEERALDPTPWGHGSYLTL